jgi:hypothetical protein
LGGYVNLGFLFGYARYFCYFGEGAFHSHLY